MSKIGRWKELHGGIFDGYFTPSHTPMYGCGACNGSQHLYDGEKYSRRKVICDNCGRINIYPWEKAFEQGSSLWREDDD